MVSSTDLNLFKRLSNPTVCDVERPLPTASAGGSRTAAKEASKEAADKRTASIQAAVRRAAEASDDEGDDDAKPASRPVGDKSSVLTAAMESRLQTGPSSGSANSPGRKDAANRQSSDSDSSDDEGDKAKSAKPAKPAKPATSQVKTSTDHKDDKTEDSAEDRLEKQAYLIELQQLERKGISLSRAFSMSDSIAELEFEVTKQNAGLSTVNTVAFMRDSLKLIISGVEVGNAKLGPFLSIDGWSASLCHDMARYDHALERVYKRYFRKQQMSPLLELAWLLLGSMVMFHVKNKIFGVGSTGGSAGVSASAASGGGIGDLLGMFMGGGARVKSSGVAPESAPPPPEAFGGAGPASSSYGATAHGVAGRNGGVVHSARVGGGPSLRAPAGSAGSRAVLRPPGSAGIFG